MKVKVDVWSGYALGGVILFDTDTQEISNPITWDNDDDRKFIDDSIWQEANPSEMFQYRLIANKILVGDYIVIKSGRKMLGEIKQVQKKFTFKVEGTYGHGDIEYCCFTDGTKVAKKHCQLIRKGE